MSLLTYKNHLQVMVISISKRAISRKGFFPPRTTNTCPLLKLSFENIHTGNISNREDYIQKYICIFLHAYAFNNNEKGGYYLNQGEMVYVRVRWEEQKGANCINYVYLIDSIVCQRLFQTYIQENSAMFLSQTLVLCYSHI